MPANDQGDLIEALRSGRYGAAWTRVRFVGMKDEPDICMRFLVFERAAEAFDPSRNNNFIGFYKNYLKFHRIARDDAHQVKVTGNRSVINLMRSQAVCPRDDIPTIVEDLMLIQY